MDNYNWDDVECAPAEMNSYSNNLNHSEFFAYKHEKHEPYKHEDFQPNDPDMQNQDLHLSEDSKVPVEVINVKMENKCQDKENSVTEVISCSLVNSSNQSKILSNKKHPNETLNDNKIVKLPLTENNNINNGNNRNNEKKLNIPPNLLQHSWRHQHTQKENSGHASKPKPMTSKSNTKFEPPTVYKYCEIYEKKRQKQLEQLLNQEQKDRIFHSRPAPDFKKISIKKSPQEHKIQVTIPITPAVLKKSKLFHEKEKQKMLESEEKLKNQLATKSLIKARDPKVLYEEPFKPKKILHSVEIDPFRLHVEDRIQKRKQYDKSIQIKLEEKKKQEEEDKQKKDDELVREFRKMTTFKARPNPFK